MKLQKRYTVAKSCDRKLIYSTSKGNKWMKVPPHAFPPRPYTPIMQHIVLLYIFCLTRSA